MHHGHGHAEHTLLQPAQGVQQNQPGQEPCTASLLNLDEYPASKGASEHLSEPLAHCRHDDLAMEGSCASSQSDDSFLSLMLGPGGLASQHTVPGCLTAVAAPPNAPTHCLLPGAGKAAYAEQPPRGREDLCLEGSPEPADGMLEDIFMQGASSDGSADWFSSAQAEPFGIDPSTLQQAAAQPSSIPCRKRGRPRLYDTTLPLGECGQASCMHLTMPQESCRQSAGWKIACSHMIKIAVHGGCQK